MNTNNKFLSLYKEYETLIRDQGIDPKEYETNVDDLSANRLRICRQLRNYLSHQNDPGFILISEKQNSFLESYIKSLKTSRDIIRKHLKNITSGACAETDKCSDVLQKMIKNKTDRIFVIGKTAVGVASIYDVSSKVLESKTNKMSSIKSKKDYILISPDTEMSDIPVNSNILCTQDGSATGKIIGVLYT